MNNIDKEALVLAARTALPPFLLSRLLIFVLIIFFSGFNFSQSDWGAGEFKLKHPKVSIESIKLALTKSEHIFLVGDANWYHSIAKKGYTKEALQTTTQRNWAFFPLFPIFWQGLFKLTGEYLISGLALANGFFFLSLMALHFLAQEIGLEDKVCSRALWLLAFFPTSYFFSLPLTESLFLMLLVLVAVLVLRSKFTWAAIVFALLTATRPTGLLLLPAFLLALLKEEGYLSPRLIGACLVAPLGILFFSAHLYYLTGHPLAWMKIQAAWRSGNFPALMEPGEILMTDWNFLLLNLVAVAACFLAGIWLAAKKHFAAAAVMIIPPLASLLTGSTISLARYMLTLFPIFFLLSFWASTEFREKLLLLSFTAVLAIMSLMFTLKITAGMA